MKSQAIRLALIIIGASAYLGLAVAGEGGPSRFLADPAVKSLGIVLLAATLIAFFAGGNISAGVREDRENRWVLSVFIVLTLADGYLPALCDRLGVAVFSGEAIRWIGVGTVLIGCVLRIWPVFILGNRFSAMVAIQEGHTLAVDGPYRLVRNPSYLGILVIMAGWALVFRSVAGLVIATFMVPFLVIRIASEERLLRQTFGAEYEAYVARTKRLVPGIY
jgi:protein-S-isoprenylcysteine O-methyltransferase Ste14